MTVQVMIPVSPETKEKAYYLKGPGRSYDKFLNEVLTALEEKMNESPAKSCQTSEPGTSHTCNCKGVV